MLAALLAAIGIYLLTDAIGQAFIERVYMSAEAQNQRNLATVSSFQTYAREFNLSSRDTEMISRWAISRTTPIFYFIKTAAWHWNRAGGASTRKAPARKVWTICMM